MLANSRAVLRSVYRRASRITNFLLTKTTIQDYHKPKIMKAYVRTLKIEDRVEIKLRYTDPDLGLDRWFNFSRSMDEKVHQIKERMLANMDKACEKYRKKKQKKAARQNLENAGEFKLNLEIMQNDQVLDSDLTCRELVEMPDVAIVVNGQYFHFDVDPPAVKSIKLPSSIMAGFPVYPSRVELENCVLEECEIIWFKSNKSAKTAPEADSDAWVPVGNQLSYSASNQDIGSWLKIECIPINSSKEGLPEIFVAPQAIEAGPGPCPFETRHNFTKEFVGNYGFRVVTYNILADLYCDSEYTRTVLHPYCPPYALAMDYRKQLILKELIGYNADIICLQEVDTKIFELDLKPIFASLGFGAEFSKKGGQVSEGMACIYNKSKFKLVETSAYILAEELPKNPLMVDMWDAVQRNEELTKRIIERTTTCQILLLQSVCNTNRIVVANTHLYFHPNADHIRLLQANIALRLAQDLRNRQIQQGNDTSLVFCGDFNSTPGSGVFEMMTLQNIDQNNENWLSKPEEAVKGLSIHNPVAMESACGTPPFTNYTSGFSGCLDYIFFEKSKLMVDQVVPFPSIEEVTHHIALPSIVFPSDHIALVADLKWV